LQVVDQTQRSATPVQVSNVKKAVSFAAVDVIVEGKKSISNKVNLFVKIDGGLIGGEHMKKHCLTVLSDTSGGEQIDQTSQQIRRNSKPSKLFHDAERQNVCDLGTTSESSRQQSLILPIALALWLQFGYQQTDESIVECRGQSEKLWIRGDVDVPLERITD
jgi:hypothetical protein